MSYIAIWRGLALRPKGVPFVRHRIVALKMDRALAVKDYFASEHCQARCSAREVLPVMAYMKGEAPPERRSIFFRLQVY